MVMLMTLAYLYPLDCLEESVPTRLPWGICAHWIVLRILSMTLTYLYPLDCLGDSIYDVNISVPTRMP